MEVKVNMSETACLLSYIESLILLQKCRFVSFMNPDSCDFSWYKAHESKKILGSFQNPSANSMSQALN